MDREKLKEYLIKLRKEKGLTQNEIAEIFVVTPQAVSKWENGDSIPDIEMLVKISQFYEVSIDQLIRGGDTSNDNRVIVKSNNKTDVCKVEDSNTNKGKFLLSNIILGFSLIVFMVVILFMNFVRYESIFTTTTVISSGYDVLFKSNELHSIIIIFILLICAILDITIGFVKKRSKILFYFKYVLGIIVVSLYLTLLLIVDKDSTLIPESGMIILFITCILYLLLSFFFDYKYIVFKGVNNVGIMLSILSYGIICTFLFTCIFSSGILNFQPILLALDTATLVLLVLDIVYRKHDLMTKSFVLISIIASNYYMALPKIYDISDRTILIIHSLVFVYYMYLVAKCNTKLNIGYYILYGLLGFSIVGYSFVDFAGDFAFIPIFQMVTLFVFILRMYVPKYKVVCITIFYIMLVASIGLFICSFFGGNIDGLILALIDIDILVFDIIMLVRSKKKEQKILQEQLSN